MNVVAGRGRAQRSLRFVDRPPRIRPGESPIWVQLDVGTADGRRWRSLARERGLGVDAWLSTLLEFDLTMRLPNLSVAMIATAAEAAATEHRLAPNEALRRWVGLAAGQAPNDACEVDELPTAVLPARVIAPVPASSLSRVIHRAVNESDHELALCCEITAANHGLTLESWMLRSVLGQRRLARTTGGISGLE